jgi:hypothetical protein
MTRAKMTIASWNRFISRNLSIHPDLIGAAHEFSHEQHKITIRLPSIKHLPTEPNRGELVTFNHYTEVDGKKTPIQYWVHVVDVLVEIPVKVSVPREMLDRPPNAFEIVSKNQQKYLNQLASTHGAIAERAFDLWLRTLRWKCDNSAIGRPEISGFESGWSTYLIAEPEDKEIWIAPMVFQAKGSKIVTPEVWEEVRSSLDSGLAPPVYADLVMDAIEHIKLGDLQRAVVDVAIACESFLRTLVAVSLPTGLQDSIITYIDDANIRPILDKFIPDILDPLEKKELDKIKGKLHAIFDVRNKIVHKGSGSGVTAEMCRGYIETAKRLIALRT